MKAGGWHTAKLGDICDLINRGVAPAYLDGGGVAVLNQKCIRDHSVNFSLARRHNDKQKRVPNDRFVRDGDVLVNSTGTGTLGRVAQVRGKPEEPATVDTHVTIVRPQADRFYLPFFGYLLQTIEAEIEKAGEGASGQTELSRATLAEKFAVSFPEDRKEQRRIVAILDEAFEGIATATANAEKNLVNADELWSRTLSDILDRGSTNSKLVRLDEVLIPDRKISYGIVKPGSHDPNGVRLIKSQQVRDDEMDLTADFRITRDLDREYVRTRIQGGEILLNLVGASIGRSAIAPPELRGANVSRAIAVIPARSEFARWVQYNLRSVVGQKLIAAGTGGSAQPVLNLAEVKAMKIRVPAASVRNALVEKLEAISAEVKELKSILFKKVEALVSLRQSIMDDAFSGRLGSASSNAMDAAAE